jgi:hypothetical protein
MRKSLGTAALLACVTIAATASAQMAMQDGRVTNVDRSGKAFSAQWYNGNALYWTNAATKFSVNGTPTNFSYIKAGMKVQISSHPDGQNMIADHVMFVE